MDSKSSGKNHPVSCSIDRMAPPTFLSTSTYLLPTIPPPTNTYVWSWFHLYRIEASVAIQWLWGFLLILDTVGTYTYGVRISNVYYTDRVQLYPRQIYGSTVQKSIHYFSSNTTCVQIQFGIHNKSMDRYVRTYVHKTVSSSNVYIWGMTHTICCYVL